MGYMKKFRMFIMKTILVAGLSILALVVGITGMTSGHFAEARGMPIHNPNWASIVANPTSQNGHAPSHVGLIKIASQTQPTSHVDIGKKGFPTLVDTTKKTSSLFSGTLVKANTNTLDIKVGQKARQ